MSVKKEDCRLGNYLYWGVNVVKVLGVINFPVLEKNNQCFYFERNNAPNHWDSEDNLDAIELTESWLDDLGFEKSILPISNCMKFFKGNISIIIDRTFHSIHVGVQRIDDRNIKYVHQLQNLYFSLTGQELTISK